MVRETPVETPRRPEPLPWPAVIAVATTAAALYALVALGRRGDSKAAGILAFSVPVGAGGVVMMLVAAI